MKNAILLVLNVALFSACDESGNSKPSTCPVDMGGVEAVAGASSEMGGEMAGDMAGEMTSDMGAMEDMVIEGGSEESADMAIEGGSTEMAGAEG